MRLKLFYDYFFTILISTTSGILLESLPYKNIYLLIIYAILFIWFGYKSLLYAFYSGAAYKNIKLDIDTRDTKLDFNTSNFSPFAFIITFGLISQQLYHFDNSLFEILTINQNSSLFEREWMIFALDNFIRAAIFDFLETYHLHISNIDSNNLYILSFVFVFKSVLSIFFVKSLINLYNSTKKIELENK
ncbi:hypothetical protein BD809_109137 [Aquimarina intermedia]|uniref:Uncharacterized protein n=1 Tax=Aquimarina intermedia TaxID=350814 RepID=A0A5S5BWK5_9FLAO|nr:hypothetical protein BD809_109137 [Aquimarina intermedia]